jgi:H+/gluconate symporter-like permease
MNKSAMHVIWKLLVVSLLVGLALDYFDISPADLIHDIPETVGRILDKLLQFINWGGKYILLGAIVVVPVWIIMNIGMIKDKLKRKN